MAKGGTLEYSIQFNINKQNLDALQKSLDEIVLKTKQFEAAMPDYAWPYQEAAEAANDLKKILNSSWNSQIGQLDLSKVEKGIVNLYGSTKNFKQVLNQIGPEGQKVFNQFTQAVLNTQTPIKQTSAMLDKMAVTFKNTIRYGIASSVWNNFSNSVSKAYGYVKELDNSLNDIRIVSGQSADEMDRLAKNANKTAQVLGNSTLDYTKAAQIYYQQGLSGTDVAERTEITLKMANVLNASAKEVSNYMTAIWNNFADGSKDLEYYADVITALGAATASSSEEIADGLEKFAAIGNTVGLSYEYATSALATVVAQTRQSADTVGTAFKTLFARIQDLELGNTLDDGTTLGKYAEALNKVGINIKDTSGELKKMDKILEEMGAKWKQLSKDEQVALAQNVAGTRQYAQLVALMDNWDKFQTNLGTATDATGTLEEQESIYLDSIEAHLNKLDAAWEGLYKNLFDEDVLKGLTDALTNIINLANTFVTGLGGGLNSIIYLALTVGNMFSNQIAEGLLRVQNNAKNAQEQIKNLAVQERLIAESKIIGSSSEIKKKGKQTYIEEFEINQKIMTLKSKMSAEDQQDLALMDQKNQKLRDEVEILNTIALHNLDIGKAKKKIEKNVNLTQEEKNAQIEKLQEEAAEKLAKAKPVEKRELLIKDFNARLKTNKSKLRGNEELRQKIVNKEEFSEEDFKQMNAIAKSLEQKLESIKNLKKSLGNSDIEKGLKKGLQEEITERKRQLKVLKEVVAERKQLNEEADNNEIVNGIQTQNRYLTYNNDLYRDSIQYLKSKKEYNQKETEELINQKKQQISNNHETKKRLVLMEDQQQAMNNIISGTFILGSSLNVINGAISTISNPDLSGWEKFQSLASVIGTQSILILSSIESIHKLLPSLLVMLGKYSTIEAAIAASKKQGLFATLKEVTIKIIEIAQDKILLAIDAARAVFAGKISTFGLATIAAFVAGAVAIGNWVINIIKANSEESKLNKELENTKKNLTEVKKETQETFDLISEYNNVQSNLSQLTEGTLEWYEAIEKANESTRELIEKWGLLANSDYTIDSSGLIKIDEDVLRLKEFEAMQKNYRAQADVSLAQVKLYEYQANSYLNKFRQAVNNKNKDVKIDNETAKQIITGSNNSKINVESTQPVKIDDKYFQSIGSTIESWVDNADVDIKFNPMTIDLTEEVAKFKSGYEAANQKMLSAQLQWASNLIRGYGDYNSVQLYNKASSEQQKSWDLYVKNQVEQRSNNGGGMNWWQGALTGAGTGAAVGAAATAEGGLTALVGGLIGAISGGIAGWAAGAANETRLKEEYAREALGYNQINGKWYNGGKEVSQKEIDKIDFDTAKRAYESGEYGTEDIVKDFSNMIRDTYQQLSNSGFTESQQQNIVDAVAAVKSGNKEFDFSILRDEERQKAIELTNSALENNAEILQKLQDSTFDNIKRQNQDLISYNQTLESQAEALGTTKEALEFYNIAMDNASKKVSEKTADTAKQVAEQYKFNKAYNNAVSVYYDNEKAIKAYAKAIEKGEEVSYDLADAMGEVSKSLKEMGLSLSSETISTHLKEIEKLLTGTEQEAEEVYKTLLHLSRLDVLKQMFGNEEQYQNFFNGIASGYEALVAEIEKTDFGNNINQQYADALSQMINATDLTVAQINELAQGLGIEIPVEYQVPAEFSVKDVKFTTQAKSVTHRYSGEMPNPAYDPEKGNEKTIPIDYAWVETTEAKEDSFIVPDGTSMKVNSETKSLGGRRNFAASLSNKNKASGSKPDKMDTLNTDVDRYHKVNTQISKVDNALKKVQSQTEKLVGRDLIGNLAQQWNLLNTQIDNYNEKLRIANQEQNELANILSSKGVTFNADGTISNYIEVIKAQEAYVNSLINNYNSMSKNAQEKYQETVEKAKEDFEKFQTDLDRYDELISDFIPDLYQSIQDAASEKIELQIKQFNYKFEIRLELQQAKRDWDEFVNHYVKTHMPELMADQKTIYDSMGTRIQQNGKGSLQVATNQANQYREQYEKFLRGENNIFSANGITDQATALEKVKEAYEKVMEEVTAVKDAQKQAHENLISQLDESQEKLDQQRQVYTAYAEQINHDIKLIELLNDKPNYKQLSQYYEDLHKNNVEELDFLRQQKMMWEQQMSQFEQGSDEWYNARDKYLASLTELNSKTEESLDNIRKAFENTIEEMYETINNNMTNGLGLDYVQEEWSLINKNADQYLDKINQMQGIRNIEKKYVDAINKTNSAAAQQKINKLMQEELKDLNSRDKLSQYDLDRAEKKYQLLLAQIALEEAQANKSQMRLRRDSQGNYSYQFVADSDAINKARDEVEKLYSDLYNFDKDAYRNNLEEAQNIYIEWQEKRKEINLTYANDEEELKKQTALLDEQYQSLITGITSQNLVIRANLQESAFQDLAYLENQDLESFTNMTEAERNAIMEDLVPQWKSGTQEMVDALLNPQTGFTKVVQDAIDESEGAVAEYQKKTHEVSVAAGEDFDEIKAHSDPAADSVERLKTNTEIFLNDIANNLQTMIDYTEQIDAQAQAYNAIAKALDAATKSHKLWIQEQETMAKAAESETPLTGNTGSQSSNNTSSNVTQSNNRTSAGGGDGVLTVGDSATFIGGKYYGDSYGGGGVGSRGAGKKVKVTLIRDDGRPYPIHVESKDGAYGWLRRDQLMGYDTGGYTGTWDDSGRLAMLHQKELVLNAQDTENMLNTVAIMRSMAYSLGSNLLAKMAGATVNGINGGASGSGALEQNVHIDAQFPNVHNAAEIENALNNLINAASQRIYERK